MSRRRILILIGIIMAAGAAFWIGRAVATTQRTHAADGSLAWLANASPAAAQAEQRFASLARQQMDAVRAEQAVLASMLPDMRFTGEQILAQVDKILQFHATLVKSVGVHLTHLHGLLPAPQGRRLMSACADSLQGRVQRRYRWRGGAQDEGFMGDQHGGPGRGGPGQGARYGRQYRGGRGDGISGLAHGLQLTPEQITWVQQQDPNFEQECLSLRERLFQGHADLVARFEDAQVAEEELTVVVDDLVAAHAALEKRIAQHIVLLRPGLSQEQRDLLSGMCRDRSAAGRPAYLGIHPGLSPTCALSGDWGRRIGRSATVAAGLGGLPGPGQGVIEAVSRQGPRPYPAAVP